MGKGFLEVMLGLRCEARAKDKAEGEKELYRIKEQRGKKACSNKGGHELL